MYSSNLGVALESRFKGTGSRDDLDQAITALREAVSSTPDGNSSCARYLNNLGNALQTRFEVAGSKADLDLAIAANEKAVELSPSDDLFMANLGAALQTRHDLTGSLEDLNRSIELKERAVEAESSSDDAFSFARSLHNLGISLISRYEQTGWMGELDRAIGMMDQAIALVPSDYPPRSMYLSNLANVLKTRFEQTKSMNDLNRAVDLSEQAFECTLPANPYRRIRNNNLAIILQRRHEQTGSISDLSQAITRMQQAVALTPVNHPDCPFMLNNLANMLHRFALTVTRMPVEMNLDSAIQLMEQSLALTTDGTPARIMCLNTLGIAMQTRFEQTGSTRDLDSAIKVIEQAIKSTSEDHSDHAGFLINLGNVLQRRFEATGSIIDLERAIVIKEKSVTLTPEDHFDRGARLQNAGSALYARFVQTGSKTDLDRAIAMTQDAVAATPENNCDRGNRLNNLGIMLAARFDRLGESQDIDQAVQILEQAIASTMEENIRRPGYVNSLANALKVRFELTKSSDDITRAITAMEDTIASTPAHHPSRALYLNNLGSALQSWFKMTGSTDILEKATDAFDQAVKCMPEDDPNRALCLNNMGIVFERRFEQTGSPKDFEKAIEMRELAVQIVTAPPYVRIQAADALSKLLIAHSQWNRAKSILEIAVGLLPNVAPRASMNCDRQYSLSQFAGLTARAGSVCLQCGDDPYHALELLETGRGVVASLQLTTRSDISVLEESYPELANAFRNIRDNLDRPRLYSKNLDISPERSLREKNEAFRRFSMQMDEILQTIRGLSGFERFLLGPSKEEMQCLAHDGTIVVFNISDVRSDACLVTKTGICSIHLPMLTPASLQTHVDKFIAAIADSKYVGRYNKARLEVNGVLEWLWDSVVKPVLAAMDLVQKPSTDDDFPRVCWVGSGLLNILPIHAAGYQDLPQLENALDCVISSYSPTFKALSYAEEHALQAKSLDVAENALVVSMPTTPNALPLRNVIKEVEELRCLLSTASISMTEKQNPSRSEILNELPKYTIVHFACHGESMRDPSQSRLLLQDWVTSPLTVSDIVSLNVRASGAKFAYLSACNTSKSEDGSLLDESISLTSAMQLSGFPSVVGTLWSVQAAQSVEVARDVYKYILAGNEGLDLLL